MLQRILSGKVESSQLLSVPNPSEGDKQSTIYCDKYAPVYNHINIFVQEGALQKAGSSLLPDEKITQKKQSVRESPTRHTRTNIQ